MLNLVYYCKKKTHRLVATALGIVSIDLLAIAGDKVNRGAARGRDKLLHIVGLSAWHLEGNLLVAAAVSRPLEEKHKDHDRGPYDESSLHRAVHGSRVCSIRKICLLVLVCKTLVLVPVAFLFVAIEFIIPFIACGAVNKENEEDNNCSKSELDSSLLVHESGSRV
jgi:hypothetical protein